MLARRSVLLLPLIAAACGSDDVPRSFPLPSYRYLTPIRLNVAAVEVDDRTTPAGGSSVEGLSPVRPSDALKQMANDRLVAGGSAGRAVFVIDQASLRRVGGGIEGTMAVHLDVFAGPGGERAGFAEARVARRRTSTDTDEDSRAVLYDFTMQMMTDMNVEFEFQVKRSLRDWTQATAGSAPPPPPVQTEDLSAPTNLAPARPGTPVLRR
ncbi:hypothetical protein [Acidisphaera sp. L21]|uniref:hypothetical protein n=1 Tax=Acidisphaera sp. L21 TaxID=1641851 RepID=UPI00131B582E|nr:hypothetical protein [Acidisphaera sp. L21]